jgi:hypothetical protein
MRPAQRNTGQVVQSMKNQLNSLYAAIIAGGVAFVIIIVVLLIVSAIPLTALIIGSLKINNCTIQSMIPIWLIVIGVTGIAMLGLPIMQVKIVSDFNSIINITTINSFILSSFAKYRVVKKKIQIMKAMHGHTL